MTAALTLARQGFDAYLVEKENELGGNLRHTHYLLNGDKPQDELARLRDEILDRTARVHLFTGAAIEKIEGTIGNFKTTISAQRHDHRNHARGRNRSHGCEAVPTKRISVWAG